MAKDLQELIVLLLSLARLPVPPLPHRRIPIYNEKRRNDRKGVAKLAAQYACTMAVGAGDMAG